MYTLNGIILCYPQGNKGCRINVIQLKTQQSGNLMKMVPNFQSTRGAWNRTEQTPHMNAQGHTNEHSDAKMSFGEHFTRSNQKLKSARPKVNFTQP